MSSISSSIGDFRKQFGGEIVAPEDAGYDEARRVWNGMIDKRPGAVARATTVDDVVAAVNFARENDVLLAVRCGAHSAPGYSTCDGGLVLDLSRMNAVTVDPGKRIATVAGGALLGDLDRASQAHGLATTAGVVSHTGVAGLTLGGGVGRLHRKYGLTIDNLQAIEMVTAAGKHVRASEDENPELFWGLRGAGHNFGVATSFEFRLHPVGPNILAGMALYPISQALDVAGAYREWSAGLDDDVISGFVLFTVPASMPFPPGVHGLKAVQIISMHVDGNASNDTLAGVAKFGTPAFSMTMPMPYLMIQTIADDVYKWGQRNYVRGGILPELPDEAVKIAVEAVEGSTGSHEEVDFLQMGGAIARVPEDATAFSGRSGKFMLNIQNVWTDPARDAEAMAWTRGTYERLAEFQMATNYVNLVEEPGADLRPVYGDAKYDRLVALKREWDPGNLFRLNQNIAP